MPLCKRIISRLDIKGSRLIKGIRLEGLRVIGDPAEAAISYYQDGADELLYLDAVASLYGRNSLTELLRDTSKSVFVPVTAGGGIRSVSDAAALLSAGADKIALNTAAFQRPELITELSQAFGSQCVVLSIQARRTGSGSWEAMAECGRERTGWDVLDWIKKAESLGAGEVLVTSVDQDGTLSGPDVNLIEQVSSVISVPFVYSGGVATTTHVSKVINYPSVSGVAIGTSFHKERLRLPDLKPSDTGALFAETISIRNDVSPENYLDYANLAGLTVGIIDYGMGNQQSLINAFASLGAKTILSGCESALSECSLLALPGVGAFPKGMANLKERGLDLFLSKWVHSQKPLLGVCLGMQMLFESSSEFEECRGLNFLTGHVSKLHSQDKDGNSITLPHVGWNSLIPTKASKALYPQPVHLRQYFVHSYAASDVLADHVLFRCEYSTNNFVSCVLNGKVAGFQFHPELSGKSGLQLLSKLCDELMK